MSAELHPERTGHRWPRELLLRGLGFVYLVAFQVLWWQLRPLFGRRGLTPADLYMDRVAEHLGGRWQGFQRLPSLFWLDGSDGAMMAAAGLGTLLALAVLGGLRNAVVMALLWACYLSFVSVGQLWLGYGWETLLLEAGFLAIFLCPLTAWRPSSAQPGGTAVVIWLYRWLAFRLWLGAGLIKIRGDACWRELTCLQWHYETQPNPHPLSRLWHAMPDWFHTGGVAANHVVELVLPFLLLGPRPLRAVAVVGMLLFQVVLILTGNLSFLNWLTIVITLAAVDDRMVGWLTDRLPPGPVAPAGRLRLAVLGACCALSKRPQ